MQTTTSRLTEISPTMTPARPRSSKPMQLATQITVTRLILAIYAVPAAPAPASGAQKTFKF